MPPDGTQKRVHDRIVLPSKDAHSLAAHRPLGSLMRARLQTYQAISLYRHLQNSMSPVEPGSNEDVPN